MVHFTDGLGSLDIATLSHHYQTGQLSPSQVVNLLFQRINAQADRGVWTFVLPEADVLKRAAELETIPPEAQKRLPLWGIPFSVKDCIDIAGLPTTCACPGFRYTASQTNLVVAQLLAAGAILLGKTNLDQFATGLVGIRTGFQIPESPFVEGYIPGGSSSGAAISVASGLVSFAIGTDTGGSGRVPAGFNNIVGLKPTFGVLSPERMVAACRTLDCVSIFALTTADAWKVFQVAKAYDPTSPFTRYAASPPVHLTGFQPGQAFRFGVPGVNQRRFFGNRDVEQLFEDAIACLISMGGTCLEIDYAPFVEVNHLLFHGAWLAERYASVGAFIDRQPEAVLPITREIILKGKTFTAVDAFEGYYHLAKLQKAIAPIWQQIDVLVVPTTGTAYSIKAVTANPLELNSNLGYYTNFVNLLDLAAIAVPNGFQQNGMPAGVTLIAPAHTERYLSQLGSQLHRRRVNRLGASPFGLPTDRDWTA